MQTYQHPGVYLEEVPGGARTIEGVATSIAAFVGDARGGPVGQPVLTHSLQDYERAFGPVADAHDEMGLAATGYYQNGGRDAYFTRLAGEGTSAPGAQEYQALFDNVLRKIRDIRLLALPGQSVPASGGGNAVIAAALAHCEATRDRVLLLDPPAGAELRTAAHVGALSLPTSAYAAFYYPRVKVPNPFYAPDTDDPSAATIAIGPSALVAGTWSRVDARRGVWKSPAGVEAALNGVAGLEFLTDDGEQDQLNPLGVNCLRALPTFGPVVWGARTLATQASPEWRYLSVRRTAIFLEQSVSNGIQWAVFEPNDHRLWSALRVNIGSFLDGLFRAGAFQGDRASDAYFVRCGLGDTMTQGDVDRGQVIVVVGFAPLKPAEFVIVRIQQKVQQ